MPGPERLSLQVFNTLARRKEVFAPVSPGRATMYTCGPTVYRYAHIGNFRSYLMADWLRRALEAAGYRVTHVKNITDVGHMRQELLERGEDKVIAAALAEGKTPQQIAEFYTEAFLADSERLNILPAHFYPRATENIGEMIELTEALVARGLAYEAGGNVYFDIPRFPEYGKLSRQPATGLGEGGRAEPDPLKRDQRDFALWKAAEPGRTLKWPSPWGDGFPGWHIECSAMVKRFLGEEIDFHTGGVDNIFPHHEDEIAQSEGALGKRHVRYWAHGQHLLVDGLKMAKSTGNVYTVAELEERGFDPLAFRYLCAATHYRARLNFTLASIAAAQRGLDRLRLKLAGPDGRATQRAHAAARRYRKAFWEAAADDVHAPRALAVAWRAARSDLPGVVKRELLLDFDRFLGLELARGPAVPMLPQEVRAMAAERHALRLAGKYSEADGIRDRIAELGFEVRDTNRLLSAAKVSRARWSALPPSVPRARTRSDRRTRLSATRRA